MAVSLLRCKHEDCSRTFETFDDLQRHYRRQIAVSVPRRRRSQIAVRVPRKTKPRQITVRAVRAPSKTTPSRKPPPLSPEEHKRHLRRLRKLRRQKRNQNRDQSTLTR